MDNMDEKEYALEWFRFAKMDLNSANYLLNMRPIPIEVICFHCQQSAEKCLKGFLVINKIRPPKNHDLIELCQLCEPFVTDIKAILVQCNTLNRYGVQPRYPRELLLTEKDLSSAIKYAKDVLDYFRLIFPTSPTWRRQGDGTVDASGIVILQDQNKGTNGD
ncbi:HEPN domain-containing protein [Treponema primitia]|uniref:HEPN domain-containing protein n=1 Tax=Treponema primitia TaxID=88058 RepID=UPI003980B243